MEGNDALRNQYREGIKKDFVQKNTLIFVCISKKYKISDVILDRLHRIY